MKKMIHTNHAPGAIGAYSQAVQAGDTVYLSGQIPLDPVSMTLVSPVFSEQAKQVFNNLRAVCEAAGSSLDDIVKLSIYLTDLGNFPQVNEVMQEYFNKPYPARATIQVSALPLAAQIEIDAIVSLQS